MSENKQQLFIATPSSELPEEAGWYIVEFKHGPITYLHFKDNNWQSELMLHDFQWLKPVTEKLYTSKELNLIVSEINKSNEELKSKQEIIEAWERVGLDTGTGIPGDVMYNSLFAKPDAVSSKTEDTSRIFNIKNAKAEYIAEQTKGWDQELMDKYLDCVKDDANVYFKGFADGLKSKQVIFPQSLPAEDKKEIFEHSNEQRCDYQQPIPEPIEQESEKKRCEYELFIENFFGMQAEVTTELTEINTYFGMLVNLLCVYDQSLKAAQPKSKVDLHDYSPQCHCINCAVKTAYTNGWNDYAANLSEMEKAIPRQVSVEDWDKIKQSLWERYSFENRVGSRVIGLTGYRDLMEELAKHLASPKQQVSVEDFAKMVKAIELVYEMHYGENDEQGKPIIRQLKELVNKLRSKYK